MTLNAVEITLLKSGVEDLFRQIETEEVDALEVRQSVFERFFPTSNGVQIQVQISIVTDVEDFIPHFTTVVNSKYEHPSV